MSHAARNSRPRINVSMSQDGGNWKNTNLPDYRPLKLKYTSGVGICGSGNGKDLYVVFNDKRKKNAIHIVKGNVNNGIVQWPASPKRLFVERADSAPSCTMLPNGMLLVAVRSKEEMVCYLYDGGDRFIAKATPGKFNDNCCGRPSLVTVRNITMMAWHRYTNIGQVIISQGELTGSGGFIPPFGFTETGALMLASSDVKPSAVGAPAIATDGKRFYVSVIQEERGAGAGTLHGWQVVLYKSGGSALYSGCSETDRIPLGLNSQAYINLAAGGNGSLIAAKVKDKPQGRNELEAQMYSGSTARWQNLGLAPWIGASSASYRPFGLTRFGINAPRRMPVDANHRRGIYIPVD
jgi:hypothetical protein